MDSDRINKMDRMESIFHPVDLVNPVKTKSCHGGCDANAQSIKLATLAWPNVALSK